MRARGALWTCLLAVGCSDRLADDWPSFGDVGESSFDGESGFDTDESDVESSSESESGESSTDGETSTSTSSTDDVSDETDTVGSCESSILVENWNGYTYYRVSVPGQMTDTTVAAACEVCGLQLPCAGPVGCEFNDDICVQTNSETSCGNPMMDLSSFVCGSFPTDCEPLYGTYQYMGHNWLGDAACGIESTMWCADGNRASDRFALCISG